MLIATKRPRSESAERTLHIAIRACYSPLFTQEKLEEATGIPQQTISKWARGASVPNPYEIAAIEEACDAEALRLGDDALRRPLGWIGRQAGLIAEVKTVPEAIAMDPALTDASRRLILRYYDSTVEEFKGGGVGPAAGL